MDDIKEYLALVEKRKTEQKPIELVMPSGATWKVAPINTKQFVVSGRLPMQLVNKLSGSKNGAVKAVEKMPEKELLNLGKTMLEITRDVMLNNLIFPKISLTPKEGCIVPEQIDPEDFEFFMNWVTFGGQATQDSFRQPTDTK